MKFNISITQKKKNVKALFIKANPNLIDIIISHPRMAPMKKAKKKKRNHIFQM